VPRRATRIAVGAGAAILADLLIHWLELGGRPGFRVDSGRLLIAGGIWAFAGTLPAILEPATSPNCRGVFHSATSGHAVWWACTRQHTEAFDLNVRGIPQSIAGGSGSLLAADSTTPQVIRLGQRSIRES
jgi:hypothetical protein